MSKYKVGDVVKSKSGGPKMTVIEEEKPGFYVCEWFDAAGNRKIEGGFVEDALILATDKELPPGYRVDR